MDIILTTTVSFVVLIVIFLLHHNGLKKKLPPGPWGIPIFGVMLFFNNPPHVKFQEYFQQYGKLCSFYIGNKLTVVISDFELIKEAFVRKGEIFSGRPNDIAFKVFPQDTGLVVCEGNVFKQYKSFIVSTLIGVRALRQFEAITTNNVEHFVNYINEMNEETVNILEPLGLSIAQTYSEVLLGYRPKHNDSILKELVSLLYQEHRLYNNGARMYFPWAKKIPLISKFIGEDDIRKIRSRIYNILETTLKKNLDLYKEGSQHNFVHSWLTEDRRKKLRNPNDNLFEKNSLVHNVESTFAAGYETTTTTLRWALLFLLNHPHVQNKIIEELDEVVGHDRPPSIDDESLLPYTLATIQEIHRCASIGPLGIPHKTKEATTLGGFNIPKNSIIFANVYSIHTNPGLFPDPHSFKPERFINSEGKFVKNENILAFSIGKRQCPGERMAHIEIFIYLTYLLQNFRFEKSKNEELIELNRGLNISNEPMDFTMKFINRKK